MRFSILFCLALTSAAASWASDNENLFDSVNNVIEIPELPDNNSEEVNPFENIKHTSDGESSESRPD